MPRTGRIHLLLAALSAAGLIAAATAASAPARTVWLCKPGQAANPCGGGLDATLVSPSGAVQRVERTAAARRAAVDCFYVYPTLSEQSTANANLVIDPQEKAAARYQASRFSSVCRIWAPMYRQFTLTALLNRSRLTPAVRTLAYNSLRSAWRDYLAHDNHGRGVVLIGHSQGSFGLRMLIKGEIDRHPSVRRRIVSALLVGGNVLVPKGRTVGGDFKNVPACRSATQLHCVVGYSTFDDTPPANSLFGRATGSAARTQEVLCTNPAALGGGSGALRPYVPTSAFPGVVGAEGALQIGPLPAVSTPWIGEPGTYTARCSRADGANVLRLTTAPGGRVLPPLPDATWGTHLADVNIALGNLTDLVRKQVAAYARAAR